jgi:hypothetical protein
MLVEYLRPITRKIVIIRDRDTKPAALQNTMRGAYALAAALLILRKEVVKVITTPTKDVRDFMAAGNTATALIYGLVKNASPCTISQCQKELAQLAHVPAANTGKTVR